MNLYSYLQAVILPSNCNDVNLYVLFIQCLSSRIGLRIRSQTSAYVSWCYQYPGIDVPITRNAITDYLFDHLLIGSPYLYTKHLLRTFR